MSKIELAPDWNKAPAWANYWAMDINGSAFWYAKKPEPDLDDEGNEYGVWFADKSPAEDDEWVKNWKETLQERPKEEVKPKGVQYGSCYVREALQWLATEEGFEKMSAFLDGFNGTWSVDYGVKPAVLKLIIDDIKLTANEYDYVIRHENGNYYVADKELFNKLWVGVAIKPDLNKS